MATMVAARVVAAKKARVTHPLLDRNRHTPP